MTIKLFKEGVDLPLREYTGQSSDCSHLRTEWIRNVRMLEGTFYIKVTTKEIGLNVQRFDRELLMHRRRKLNSKTNNNETESGTSQAI